MTATSSAQRLLAVDLGQRTGLALFEGQRLLWYRSQHFGRRNQLRRAIPRILREAKPACLYVEGDRGLAALWAKVAERLGILLKQVSPETWREPLLLPRERRDPKAHAARLAREVIQARGGPKPIHLRHDAAEAILIGDWALKFGETQRAES